MFSYGKIQIIGGKWKGRKIYVLRHVDIRPTTSCMRETLFNWLYKIVPGAICLDCFAGTGALGLEALSRGACGVTFLEHNLACVKVLLRTMRSFKEYNSEVIYVDSLHWMKKSNRVYDIVFLDPPFKKNVISKVVFLLEKHNLLRQKAWIYIESANYQDIFFNSLFASNWVLYRKKFTKFVKYYLYLRNL